MPLPASQELTGWRRAAIGSLSFAGLLLLSDNNSPIYSAVINQAYFAFVSPVWNVVGGFLAALITLTIAGVLVWRIWPRRFAKQGMAILLYVLVILVLLLFRGPAGMSYPVLSWLRLGAFLSVALIYWLRGNWIEQLVRSCLLFGLCFVPIVIIPVLLTRTGAAPREFAARPSPATSASARRGRIERIVWIIFDEFDYRAAFEARSPKLKLTALDALRRESLFLTDARPAGLWTLDAIPSYITGKPYRRVVPSGPANLMVYPSPSGDPYRLDAKQTIFGTLSAQGARISIHGYYHPYPRLLNALHLDAEWFHNVDANPAFLNQEVSDQRGFLTGLGVQLFSHPAWPLALPYKAGAWVTSSTDATRLDVAAANQASGLGSLMPSAIRAACDPSYDFVYIHLPLPHPPGVARLLGKWVDGPKTGIAYLDNLLVADGFISTLRRDLVASGLWDRTNLIVTSDHPLRPSVWRYRSAWIGDERLLGASDRGRIPFLYKPAGGGAGSEIAGPVPLLCLHDLLIELAEGRVRGVGQAKDWILANSRRYPLRWGITAIGGMHVD